MTQLPGLSLVFLMSLFSATAAERGDSQRDLERATHTLQAAFRQSEAARLRSILPREGRIYVSLPSLVAGRGYFSAGQCEALLAEAFRKHPIEAFRTGAPDREEERRATLPGYMRITGPEGQSVSVTLHFLLSMESEVWVLREIREHQPA